MHCLSPAVAVLCWQRRAMLGLPEGDTDPFFDTLKDQDGPQDDQAAAGSDSDEEYEFEQEPPELLAARQQLAAFTARPGEEEPPGGKTYDSAVSMASITTNYVSCFHQRSRNRGSQ